MMSAVVTSTGRERVPIEAIYLGLYDGPHATPKPASEGPVFLGIKNITEDGRLDLSEIRHIAEEDFSDWTRRVTPHAGDIVFTYEATLNRYAVIPKGFRGCLGRRLALIRPNSEKIDTKFLFYYFFGRDWRTTISKNILSGSTVDRIPLSSFPTFEISIPRLCTQRKIAAVLSAYDGLIENNTRRIAILEEMAQSLYREWFVHYRFPGHEKKRLVESPLGMIPEGWEVKAFAEIADFVNGFAFEPRHWGKVGKPIIKIAELKNGIATKTPFYEGVEVPIKYHIQNGDVLFSWSADLDVYIWSGGQAFLNQHLFNVLPYDGVTRIFLFYSLKDHIWEFRSKSQGTTMRHIKRAALDEVKLVIPPVELRTLFESHAEPVILEIQTLTGKNANLRRTRDLLLPKLISGELDVEGLEIEMEGAQEE